MGRQRGDSSVVVGAPHVERISAFEANHDPILVVDSDRVEPSPISAERAAFASVFHDDGVWTLWTGDVWKGRRAIEQGHAAAHKTVFLVKGVRRETVRAVV
jgi:hypothetical protein